MAKTAASGVITTVENVFCRAEPVINNEVLVPLSHQDKQKRHPLRCRLAVLVEIRGVEPLTS